MTKTSLLPSHSDLSARTVSREDSAFLMEYIRVLHVINGEHYAGAERVQDLLSSELPASGVDVGLACLKPDQFPQVRRCRGASLYEIPMQSRFDLRPVARLIRLVREENYQLLHAHTPRTALLASIASLVTGVPMVYHVHSPTSRDTTFRWRNRLNALTERIAMSRASALITVSESLGRHVRQMGIAKSKVHVVQNGVPCCTSSPTRKKPDTEWTLGTVAFFRPRKGIEVLLHSLALLKLQGLQIRLRAVGCFETSEYEREVKQLATKLGVSELIDWIGFTENVEHELHAMDIFILPSLFGEGLPMVVLEAMAAGAAVVASRVEGIPEAIRDGVDGLIVEPGDPKDLAEALARVICGDVDWNKLRESALCRQVQRFSDQSMAAGVAEVYRQVLAAEAKK